LEEFFRKKLHQTCGEATPGHTVHAPPKI